MRWKDVKDVQGHGQAANEDRPLPVSGLCGFAARCQPTRQGPSEGRWARLPSRTRADFPKGAEPQGSAPLASYCAGGFWTPQGDAACPPGLNSTPGACRSHGKSKLAFLLTVPSTRCSQRQRVFLCKLGNTAATWEPPAAPKSAWKKPHSSSLKGGTPGFGLVFLMLRTDTKQRTSSVRTHIAT